jgi:hypothetical protein
MNPELDIDNIKKHLFIERINFELKDLNKKSDRYKYLIDILNQLNSQTNDTLDETLDKVNSDEYKKKWFRLSKFHKLIKLKEYIIEKNLQSIEKELIKAIEDKQLYTAKEVTYDNVNLKIVKLKFNGIDY